MKQQQSLIAVVSARDGGRSAVDQAATFAMQNIATVTLVDAITLLRDFIGIAGSTGDGNESGRSHLYFTWTQNMNRTRN